MRIAGGVGGVSMYVLVINRDAERMIEMDGKTIGVVLVWKWLLNL